MSNFLLAKILQSAGCRRSGQVLLRHRRELGRRWAASITGHERVDRVMDTMSGGRVEGWMKAYEDMVGLTEVRHAQNKVMTAESSFLGAQTERRKCQQAMSDVHSRLATVRSDLDKVQRGDERYLSLITAEFQIFQEEKKLQTELGQLEEAERTHFSELSSTVRESHEKERARTERTKYWSVIGSVIGVTLGILGTSINNYLRMRELRGIVQDSAAGGVELKQLVGHLSDTIRNQHNHVQTFVSDLKGLLSGSAPATAVSSLQNVPASDTTSTDQLEAQTKQILETVRQQDETLLREMSDIKKVLAAGSASQTDGSTVVYVGPEVESLLKQAENNLEWKIKVNALWTITFIYGAMAITLPIIYHIAKGSG